MSQAPTPSHTTQPSPRLRLPLVLPPPVHAMASLTTKDRDRVQHAFVKQFNNALELKDAVMETDDNNHAGRKKALQAFSDSLVRL
jgi:hypothetical protein